MFAQNHNINAEERAASLSRSLVEKKGFSASCHASSDLPQAGTCHAECRQVQRFAFRAAALRVVANDSLHVVRASVTGLALAASVVDLSRLVVAALEADEVFEAHLEVYFSLVCRVVSESQWTSLNLARTCIRFQ